MEYAFGSSRVGVGKVSSLVLVLSIGGCVSDASGATTDNGYEENATPLVDDSPPPEAPPPTGRGSLEDLITTLTEEKPAVMARQQELLEARYDLRDRPSPA